MRFDQWLQNRACEHAGGVLLHHFIGNIALVGLLREELATDPGTFPLLLKKVVYSGTHCGDFVPVEEIEPLAREVQALANLKCQNPEAPPYLEAFRKQMSDLVDCASRVKKPIYF